ncbi:MAG: 1-acyl-sn-glycerol-3-phosphate acyltransferase [Candidatus Brocadiaceae bacterium]|nr:1-acyl-sn-glycerol-3-phosphate acyltransferase [Candidatus Brocadiaceae bacterium]
MKVFYRVRVEKKERIPLKGPVIVAANHFSYMDPVVLQSMFPRRIFFMMTEVYYEGRWKWLFTLLRCICVKQEGSNIASLKAGIRILNKNGVLGIFPEGGVSKEGILQEGNPGIGFLVTQSGAPVLPVFLSGTHKALPKGAKIPKISRLTVTYGDPITFKFPDKKTNKEVITEITRRIMEQIKALT